MASGQLYWRNHGVMLKVGQWIEIRSVYFATLPDAEAHLVCATRAGPFLHIAHEPNLRLFTSGVA